MLCIFNYYHILFINIMFDTFEFQKSLKILKNNNELSDLQKIHAFYQLCDEYTVEPILSRLTGEIKNRFFQSSYLITFTNARIIISRKGLLRNFLDFGYIAGLGPFLYYIVSDKVKFDVKINNSYIADSIMDINSRNNFYINYHDIKKLVFYRGIETMTTNMLGSTLIHNVFRIFSYDNLYEYIISVRKNGDYEKIFYWLKLALPIPVFEE